MTTGNQCYTTKKWFILNSFLTNWLIAISYVCVNYQLGSMISSLIDWQDLDQSQFLNAAASIRNPVYEFSVKKIHSTLFSLVDLMKHAKWCFRFNFCQNPSGGSNRRLGQWQDEKLHDASGRHSASCLEAWTIDVELWWTGNQATKWCSKFRWTMVNHDSSAGAWSSPGKGFWIQITGSETTSELAVEGSGTPKCWWFTSGKGQKIKSDTDLPELIIVFPIVWCLFWRKVPGNKGTSTPAHI